MDENLTETSGSVQNAGSEKEAVCIDAMRVYDSCSDKDCLEDLRVYFSPENRDLIEHATNVRIRGAEVITVFLDLDPIPFNKGFYSIDLTFFFNVCLDVFCPLAGNPTVVNGISIFTKKVILYGSEGNVKRFTSDAVQNDLESQIGGGDILPKAICQVAEPIGLAARICENKPHKSEYLCNIPDCVSKRYGGEIDFECGRAVYVTLGLFTIVQIVRNVQILVPAYDFCIPKKECVTSSDDPCEVFRRIDFPTDEFFPPKVGESNNGGTGGEPCRK